jgi:hypothetical protein
MNGIKNIHIPTPHFSTSWYKGPLGIDLPSFSVEWRKLGAIFTQPTLFATPYGMQGVGEAGAEAVLPLSTLWAEMTTRLDRALAMRDYGSAERVDYRRIERAMRNNPVVIAVDGRELAVTMVDRNELAVDSRDLDLVYGVGG